MAISYDFFFFSPHTFVRAFYLQESGIFFPTDFLEEKQTNKQQNKHPP